MEGRVGAQQGGQGGAQQHGHVQQDAGAVEQQAQEGPVVVEAHAAAQQAAVVVPAQDADAAGGAVPAAGRHLALALVTVTARKGPRVSAPSSSECPAPACEPVLGKRRPPSLSLRLFTGNAGGTPLPGPPRPSTAGPRALPALTSLVLRPFSGSHQGQTSAFLRRHHLAQVAMNSHLDYGNLLLTSLPDSTLVPHS